MFKGLLNEEFDSTSDSSEEETGKSVNDSKILLSSVLEKIDAERNLDLTSNQKARLPSSKDNLNKSETSVQSTRKQYKTSNNQGKLSQKVDVRISKILEERKLKEALKKGDVEKAVSITSNLCQHDLTEQAEKVAEVQKYNKRKEAKEQKKINRKRKKLSWTFESKKKWETKSNM